jgi:hypothetical protein
MNEFSKSIWVGTVDFFGIIIPGLLIIVMCTLGFMIPIATIIQDLYGVQLDSLDIGTNSIWIMILPLVMFSYLFGYILRLSSPDVLDRKSAKKVIKRELAQAAQKGIPLTVEKWMEEDGWPFNPYNRADKYPYLGFKRFLKTRGHEDLIKKELVSWGPDRGIPSGQKPPLMR